MPAITDRHQKNNFFETAVNKPSNDYRFRNVDADILFQQIQPHLSECGITRVADITGLDWIGIPVWLAIRPNSKSLSVSQGKGTTPADARIGAVMESLESYFAEEVQLPYTFASYYEMKNQEPRVINPEDLYQVQYSLYHHHRPIQWSQAHDLITDSDIWVPTQLIDLNFSEPQIEFRYFMRSSSGLASSSNFTEACYHAMCEVIERDAFTISNELYRSDIFENQLIKQELIKDEIVCNLLKKVHDAGLTCLLTNLTRDIHPYTISAILYEEQATRPLSLTGFFFGSGTHHNPYHAMTRAITEAIQGRLTLIAGARDDISRTRYNHNQTIMYQDVLKNHIQKLTSTLDPSSLPQMGKSSVTEDIQYTVSSLQKHGVEHIAIIDLSPDWLPIKIARVIIPKLEGAFHHEGIKRSKRYYEFAQRKHQHNG